jgi:hypothetical protein
VRFCSSCSATITLEIRSRLSISWKREKSVTPPDSGRNPEWTRDGARVVFGRRVGDSDEYVSRARDRSSADIVLSRTKVEGIAPGDIILGAPHGLAYKDGAKGIDVLLPGAQFSRTYDRPGTFDYLCAVHPYMTGKVVVQAR